MLLINKFLIIRIEVGYFKLEHEIKDYESVGDKNES